MADVPAHNLDVYVHVGAPKSGSTFVQNQLWAHRVALQSQGVLYPYNKRTEHFDAMLDLRERGWGGIRRQAVDGTWDRIAARVCGWNGHTAILTNELLGGASKAQIVRLVESLQPARVHVVYTARDLARQLLSSWQEQIKHNLAVTLEEFLSEMLQHGPGTRPAFARQFWPLQDADHVLQRWADIVGRERIRLVTVPAPGVPASGLWDRFCSAVGLRLQDLEPQSVEGNQSLTVAEAEFFRRVNAMVSDFAPRDYAVLVRNTLMRQVATGQGDRLTLPEVYFDTVRDRALSMIEALERNRYPLIGELNDLVPDVSDHVPHRSPHEVSDDQLLPMATKSMDILLHKAVDSRAAIPPEPGLAASAKPPPAHGRVHMGPQASRRRQLSRKIGRIAKATLSRLSNRTDGRDPGEWGTRG